MEAIEVKVLQPDTVQGYKVPVTDQQMKAGQEYLAGKRTNEDMYIFMSSHLQDVLNLLGWQKTFYGDETEVFTKVCKAMETS